MLQLTVTSISQILYPTVHKQSGASASGSKSADPEQGGGGQQLASHFQTASGRVPSIEEEPSSLDEEPGPSARFAGTPLSDLPVRYHYSAPAIHVV